MALPQVPIVSRWTFLGRLDLQRVTERFCTVHDHIPTIELPIFGHHHKESWGNWRRPCARSLMLRRKTLRRLPEPDRGYSRKSGRLDDGSQSHYGTVMARWAPLQTAHPDLESSADRDPSCSCSTVNSRILRFHGAFCPATRRCSIVLAFRCSPPGDGRARDCDPSIGASHESKRWPPIQWEAGRSRFSAQTASPHPATAAAPSEGPSLRREYSAEVADCGLDVVIGDISEFLGSLSPVLRLLVGMDSFSVHVRLMPWVYPRSPYMVRTIRS